LFKHWEVEREVERDVVVLDVPKLAPPERRRVIEGIHLANTNDQNSLGMQSLEYLSIHRAQDWSLYIAMLLPGVAMRRN
jgi:hypothetical protein